MYLKSILLPRPLATPSRIEGEYFLWGGDVRVGPLAARDWSAPKNCTFPPRKPHTINKENDVTARVKGKNSIFAAPIGFYGHILHINDEITEYSHC